MKIGQSLFNMFLSFRFIPIAGIIMGLWVYSMQSEQVSLLALLVEERIYFVSLLTVVGVNLLLWVFVEHASLYDIKGYFIRVFRDIIVINAVMLGTIAANYLLHTFVLT